MKCGPVEPSKGRAGFTLPFTWIFLLLVAALVWFFGWSVLLYVLGAFAMLAFLTWIHDTLFHASKCRWCAAARAYVQEHYPGLEVSTTMRSHRAKEDTCMVIAVFAFDPKAVRAMPTPYKLIQVPYTLRGLTELPPDEAAEYRIKNYK